MVVSEATLAGVTLADGGVRPGSPFVWQAAAADRRRPGWSGLLLACVEPVEPAPRDAELAAEILSQFAQGFDAVSRADALPRIDAAWADANALLLAHNARRGFGRRVLLGITCVVQSGSDLFIAQSPPGQLLLRRRSERIALPELASWLPGYCPRGDEPTAKPLGLSAQAPPALLRIGFHPDDGLLALSSGLARALAIDAGGWARTGGSDLQLDAVFSAAQRHGVARGFAVCAQPVAPLTPSYSRHGRLDVISVPDESRNRTVNPLDPDAPNVQTERADRRTIAWLGSPAPGQPARHIATSSERQSEGPGGLTDEMRPAPFSPAATHGVTGGHRSIDGSGAGDGVVPDGIRAALARLLTARRMSRAAH